MAKSGFFRGQLIAALVEGEVIHAHYLSQFKAGDQTVTFVRGLDYVAGEPALRATAIALLENALSLTEPPPPDTISQQQLDELEGELVAIGREAVRVVRTGGIYAARQLGMMIGGQVRFTDDLPVDDALRLARLIARQRAVPVSLLAPLAAELEPG